jgi:protein-tyrosine-phosphatase
MAEALLKQRLTERGLADRYRIQSAGIIARQGLGPPPDAVRAAAERGVDITQHLSTPLTRELLNQADLVVAMDRSNVEHILNLVPGLVPRLRLLKQYEPGARGFDIPDPMGYPIEIFRDSYNQITLGIDGLVEALARAPAP